MSLSVPAILGLIGLISALTSSGVSIGKGAAQSSEESKAKRRDEDIKISEKKNKELADKAARRKAIANVIGSKLDVYREQQDAMEPYKPRDLSGFDVAGQVAGATGQLASGLSQSTGNGIDSTVASTGGEQASSGSISNPLPEGSAGEGNWIKSTPNATDTIGTQSGSLALAKKPYSRYGSYLSTRNA